MNFKSYYKYLCFASAVHLFCESSAITTKLKPLFSDSVVTEISNTTIRSRHDAHFNCAVGHKHRMFPAVVGFILLCCHKTPRHKKVSQKMGLVGNSSTFKHLSRAHSLFSISGSSQSIKPRSNSPRNEKAGVDILIKYV